MTFTVKKLRKSRKKKMSDKLSDRTSRNFLIIVTFQNYLLYGNIINYLVLLSIRD